MTFCNASIGGGKASKRVKLDTFAMFARCRLVLQLRKYRRIAANEVRNYFTLLRESNHPHDG